jgi:hypothetical protein
MRIRTSHWITLALVVNWGSALAQQPTPVQPAAVPGATVRLEPHKGGTEFKLGDPIVLDLVFTGHSPGYVVNTDRNPYQPTSDVASITPAKGWVRSHSAYRGNGQNGNAEVDLGADPVRVPILLNRTILFQKPGHYDVAIETERLRNSGDWTLATPEDCKPCRTTNTIGIDLGARDEQDEAALVASFSKELEETKQSASGIGMTDKEEASLASDGQPFAREFDALRRTGTPDEEKLKALLQKENEVLTTRFALIQQRKDERRKAAEQLAYLGSDDAIRAKVHFIVEDRENGDADPVSHIMLDGLPSSNNWQLQLDLLQAAWRDPSHVPTDILHSALRQAKELLENGQVTDDAQIWAGPPQQREANLEKYRSELNEIVATLPQRTSANRAETVAYLDRLAVQVDH